MSYISGRWVCMSFLAAAIVALTIVPEAGAQTGRGRRNGGAAGAGAMQRGGRGNRNGMANQNNAAVANALKVPLHSLAQADHDYQGHRVRAMKHVETAIRHLMPAAARRAQQSQAGSSLTNGGLSRGNGSGVAVGGNGNGNGSGNGAGGTTKQRLPQATSDQYLKQALQSLTVIHSQIMSGGSTQNHAHAAVAIENAVRELNVALGIR